MSSETVTVACKLPNVLLCRVFQPVKKTYGSPNGATTEVTEYFPSDRTFVLNGTAAEAGFLPAARLPSGLPGRGNAEMLDSGFALTPGVPKDLWDAWLEQNKANDFIRNGLVFAHRQPASVKKQAKDHAALTSGFEPIDPENPGRDIEPTDEQKKRLRANRLRAA